MGKKNKIFLLATMALSLLLSACQEKPVSHQDQSSAIRVIAVESFLADIAQNVAGDRLVVEADGALELKALAAIDPIDPAGADYTKAEIDEIIDAVNAVVAALQGYAPED